MKMRANRKFQLKRKSQLGDGSWRLDSGQRRDEQASAAAPLLQRPPRLQRLGMLSCPKPWGEHGAWGVGTGCVRGWQRAEPSLAECGCWYRWDTTATPGRWILYRLLEA